MSGTNNPLNIRQMITGAAGAVTTAAAAGYLSQELIRLYGRNQALGDQQNIRFPSDLKNAYIHMKFKKYVRRSINDQPFFQVENGIRLPIPSKLTDDVSVQYDTAALGSAMGAVADVANPQSIQNMLTGGTSQLAGAAGTVAAGVAAQAITNAVNTSQNTVAGITGSQAASAAQAVSGITTNPFQAVLFKNPNFKKHSFSWKFVPKNIQESNVLENIIRLFKYHTLPGLGTGGVFFTYPEILEIQLFPRDEYLYKFKHCVVETVSVNYAPNGPSFYRDTGAPAAVDLTIQLQEIEIWTKQDYLNGGPVQFVSVL